MATSNVSICNLSLQKLGAARIAALAEASKNARECNACFEHLRDSELRANKWKFSLKRAILAASSTQPAFYYNAAFPLPNDCLRPIFPPILGLDWKVENHEDVPSLMTNDGGSIELRYIAKVTDPTLFDPLFIEALACKIALHLCEALTQSNTKKEAAERAYLYSIREAKRINAIEIGRQIQPVDEWLAARRTGQLVNSEWSQE